MLQVFAEGFAQVVAFEGEFDGGLQKALLVARVVTLAFELVAVDGPAAQHVLQAVGQLNLAATAGFDGLERGEDLRRQNVTPDDGEVGGSVGGLGFLHQVADAVEPVAAAVVGDGLGIHHAIGGNVLARDFHQRQHRRGIKLVDVQQLPQAGGFGVDDVVGKNDGEGFLADQFVRPQDGVAQTERLFLADVGDVDHVGDGAHGGQQVLLVAGFEEMLELEADVEVIFDGALAAAGDDDDVLDAGVLGFLDAVLDQGLVDERQHLLRHRFGRRKKASPEPGRGENRLTNFPGHSFSILSARGRSLGYGVWIAVNRLFQDRRDGSQFLAYLAEKGSHFGGEIGTKQIALHALALARFGGGPDRFGFGSRFEKLARALDGEALLVEQALDLQHHLDVLAAVEPVAGAGFLGAQPGKLGFPEAQHVGLDAGQARHVADPEVEFVGDLRQRSGDHVFLRTHDVPL